MHVGEHLGQVTHVDQCAAERTIAEMLDLGPAGALAIGAGVAWDLRHRLELVRDAGEGGMLPVLDLVPMIAPADAVGALTVLGDDALEAHVAGGVEQNGSDLSLLEGSDEDAVRPAAQQLLQVGLPQMQRQSGEVVAVTRAKLTGALTAPHQDAPKGNTEETICSFIRPNPLGNDKACIISCKQHSNGLRRVERRSSRPSHQTIISRICAVAGKSNSWLASCFERLLKATTCPLIPASVYRLRFQDLQLVHLFAFVEFAVVFYEVSLLLRRSERPPMREYSW